MSQITVQNNNWNNTLNAELQDIASQAYGHRSSEQSNGGMGYMGLLKSSDGTVSVFKCLTHRSEYNKFEKDLLEDDNYDALRNASDALKTELLRLGKAAGADMAKLEEILNTSDRAEGFLSRKMVAKAVTEISKAATQSNDAQEFWKNVKYTGYVKNTKLAKAAGGETVGFEAKSTNVSKLNGVAEMKMAAGLPKDLKELRARLEDGNIGEAMFRTLEEEMRYFNEYFPKLGEDKKVRQTKNSFSYQERQLWMIDQHKDLAFGCKTLANSDAMTGWDRIHCKLFRLSLTAALDHIECEMDNDPQEAKAEKAKPEFMKRTIMRVMLQALTRTYYLSASLEISLQVAQEKELGFINEELLGLDANNENVDKILSHVSHDYEKRIDTSDGVVYGRGKDLLSGGNMFIPSSDDLERYPVNEKEHGEKTQVMEIVKKHVSFVFSAIKYPYDVGDIKTSNKINWSEDKYKLNFNDDSMMTDLFKDVM